MWVLFLYLFVLDLVFFFVLDLINFAFLCAIYILFLDFFVFMFYLICVFTFTAFAGYLFGNQDLCFSQAIDLFSLRIFILLYLKLGMTYQKEKYFVFVSLKVMGVSAVWYGTQYYPGIRPTKKFSLGKIFFPVLQKNYDVSFRVIFRYNVRSNLL